jgi:hypothetical protein
MEWKNVVVFLPIWNIIWAFGNYVVIWYIFPRSGTLYPEKSGNPASSLEMLTSIASQQMLERNIFFFGGGGILTSSVPNRPKTYHEWVDADERREIKRKPKDPVDRCYDFEKYIFANKFDKNCHFYSKYCHLMQNRIITWCFKKNSTQVAPSSRKPCFNKNVQRVIKIG